MSNAGFEEAQTGIKIARRNINNFRYSDDTTIMAESEELKSLLMKVKEESETVGLKLKILEGSGGEGGGRGDRDGEYMYIHGWFMSMYDKNHYNIVK